MGRKKVIKVNFGCFEKGLPGWINVDNAWRHIVVSKIPGLPKMLYLAGFLNKRTYGFHVGRRFKGLVYGDVTKRLRFESNSVDYIYSSNMGEHLYPRDAVHFFTECKRILKKGGVLRLLLPDIETMARNYLEEIGKADSAKKFSYLVFANDCRKGWVNAHKWAYDKYSLRDILESIGFSEVSEVEMGKGDFPDIAKLDHCENSLYFEARK